LLCIFVPPPTSLIMIVNLASFHQALSLLINFHSVSGLSRLLFSCCRWPESKSIVCSKHYLDFVL